MNLPCKKIFITSFATVLFFVIFANPAISSDDDSIPSECYTNMAKIEADAKAYAVKYVQDAVKKHLQAGNVFEAFITAEGSCMKLSLLPEKSHEGSITFRLFSTDSNNLGEYQFFTDSLFSLQISPKNVGAKVIKKILANAKRVRLTSDNKIVSITSSTGAILNQNRQKEVTVVLTSKSKTIDSSDAVKKISSSKGLSFKDGRYVTNQKYCALKESQLNSLDKSAAQNIRTLKANEIDNHFDQACTVGNIRKFKNGSVIVYDSICRAEGKKQKTRKSLVKLSDTSFKQDGEVYSLCKSSFASQMSADQIKGVQGVLLALGYDPGKADGKFKKKTFKAIKNFQTQNKIPVTSKLDKVTYDELLSKAKNIYTAVKENNTQNTTKLEIVESDSGIAKQYAVQNARAEQLRKKLIENPIQFYDALKEQQVTHFSSILKNKEAVTRLLNASVPFISCWETEQTVIGFYNVTQHIWSIFWLNKNDQILKGRLSKGFSPIDEPEKVGWYDFYSPNTPMINAIDKAFRIQERAYFMLFHHSKCEALDKNINYVFTDNDAAATVSENERSMLPIDSEFLEFIQKDTMKKYNIDNPENLTINFAMEISDNAEINFITFHTHHYYRSSIIIRTWKKSKSHFELVDDISGVLGVGNKP